MKDMAVQMAEFDRNTEQASVLLRMIRERSLGMRKFLQASHLGSSRFDGAVPAWLVASIWWDYSHSLLVKQMHLNAQNDCENVFGNCD